MDIFLENAGIEPSSLNVVARMNDLQKTKQILLFPLEESAHKRSFILFTVKTEF